MICFIAQSLIGGTCILFLKEKWEESAFVNFFSRTAFTGSRNSSRGFFRFAKLDVVWNDLAQKIENLCDTGVHCMNSTFHEHRGVIGYLGTSSKGVSNDCRVESASPTCTRCGLHCKGNTSVLKTHFLESGRWRGHGRCARLEFVRHDYGPPV